MTNYILSYVIALLTIVLIPFALKSRNRVFTICALVIPLVVNIVMYSIYLNDCPQYGYLAIVGFISLFLIRKKTDETTDNQDKTTENQQKHRQS